jgi:hypothetical protein
MVHRTQIGERVKALRQEAKKAKKALEAARELRTTAGAREHPLGDLEQSLRDIQEQSLAEAAALKNSGLARLEDLHVFTVEKTAKKGGTYQYWYAAWREGSKVKPKYLGACSKMSQGEATEKARKLKAATFGIDYSTYE